VHHCDCSTATATFTNGTYFMDTPHIRQVDTNEDDNKVLVVIRWQQCPILLLSQYCIKGNYKDMIVDTAGYLINSANMPFLDIYL
jgi:hypothetical protein